VLKLIGRRSLTQWKTMKAEWSGMGGSLLVVARLPKALPL